MRRIGKEAKKIPKLHSGCEVDTMYITTTWTSWTWPRDTLSAAVMCCVYLVNILAMNNTLACLVKYKDSHYKLGLFYGLKAGCFCQEVQNIQQDNHTKSSRKRVLWTQIQYSAIGLWTKICVLNWSRMSTYTNIRIKRSLKCSAWTSGTTPFTRVSVLVRRYRKWLLLLLLSLANS